VIECPDILENTVKQEYITSCSGAMKEKIYLLMKKTRGNLLR
jgi:hypothetical protein